jgi:hypothetical protein
MNKKLIQENVLLSAALIVAFVVVGFVLSYPVGWALHPDVLAFKLGQQHSLSGDDSESYELTRRIVVLFSAIVGAVAAQAIFLVGHLGEKKNAA